MTYQISGHTQLGCLLGTPVAHSVSPLMHNEAFRILGMYRVYLCFDTKNKDLGTIVDALRQMNVFGFNLTMPDKERIIPYLDELSPAAQMIGAVNTVVNTEGRLIGHNTDGIGYMRSLQDVDYDCTSGPMTLLGAGGAARAIAVELANAGAARIDILNRGKARGEELCALINEKTATQAVLHLWDGDFAIPADTTLLVQATSIGLYPDESCPALDFATLRSDITVCDIVPNPPRTALIRRAEEAGCRTFTGLPMLVAQGAVSFKLWTGKDAPRDVMEAALAADQG